MPRYFFDVSDGKELPDTEGAECAGIEEAREEALRTAGGMLRDMKELWDGELWTMTVRDESGKTVATLTFSAR